MIEIDEYHASTGGNFDLLGTRRAKHAYRVTVFAGPAEVNFRMHRLWRSDSRYPGTMSVRRHESGGVEFSFDASRHGAKPRPPIIVDKDDVDGLILSLLEVRTR